MCLQLFSLNCSITNLVCAGNWANDLVLQLLGYIHFSNLNLESQEDLLKTEGRSQQEGWGALHAPGT